MQFATHGVAERFVDELMLLELGFAGEFRGNDDRRIMVIVAGKVGDFDLGVRNAQLDQALDFRRWHGHRVTLPHYPSRLFLVKYCRLPWSQKATLHGPASGYPAVWRPPRNGLTSPRWSRR